MAVDEPGPEGSRSSGERSVDDPKAVTGPSPIGAGRSLVGVSFGRYQILEELGGGGMGVVYRAHDTRLDRTVALKFLPTFLSNDSQARSRFFAEARAASALDHANVCTVHEIGETDDGQIFISMAAYNGETLKKKISRGRITPELAMDYAVQTARGLARAHAKGIIHRDIKPANIMVTDDGVVKILDFGTAKTQDLALTQTGTSIGTVGYMSPEQAEGDAVDARTDLWSLGAVLYQMLSGEEPFKGDRAVAIVYSILCEEPQPLRELLEDIPLELDALVRRCLAKDKEERYGSANELVADLEAVATRSGAQLSLAPATTRYMTSPKGAARKKWGIAAAAILAALVSVPAVRNMAPAVGLGGNDGRQYLAVLPFDATDPGDEIMAAGLTQSLTGLLARLGRDNDSLWVVPASDIRSQGVVDATGAWRAFRTTVVVTGSIARAGGEPSLVLNRVETDGQGSRVVDSATLPSPSDPSFLNEAERGLVALLGTTLLGFGPGSGQSGVRAADAAATSSEAYPFYIQGLGYLSRAYERENVSAARTLFSQAIAQDPEYAAAHAGLCEATWEMYLWTREADYAREAVASCDRAYQLAEDEPSVLIPLAATYVETGQHRQAIATLERVRQQEPDNEEVYRWLGRAYEDMGRTDEAEAAFRRAISLRPDIWVNYEALAFLLVYSGRFAEASEMFERVGLLAPDHQLADIYLSMSKLGENQVDDAEALLRRSIQKQPQALAYRNLGHLLSREERYEEAITEIRRGLELSPNDWWSWRWLGHAHHWNGDSEQARRAWNQVIALAEPQLEVNPTNVEILGGLAEAHVALNQVNDARRYLDRLTALPAKRNYVNFYTGRIYEMLGNREAALTYLGRALREHYDPIAIERDRWLDDLRQDPRWLSIVSEVQANEI